MVTCTFNTYELGRCFLVAVLANLRNNSNLNQLSFLSREFNELSLRNLSREPRRPGLRYAEWLKVSWQRFSYEMGKGGYFFHGFINVLSD